MADKSKVNVPKFRFTQSSLNIQNRLLHGFLPPSAGHAFFLFAKRHKETTNERPRNNLWWSKKIYWCSVFIRHAPPSMAAQGVSSQSRMPSRVPHACSNSTTPSSVCPIMGGAPCTILTCTVWIGVWGVKSSPCENHSH